MSTEPAEPETPRPELDRERAFWGGLATAGALYRWILASLVALNGGGIVALTRSDGPFTSEAVPSAALIFAMGCFLAVLGAMASAMIFIILAVRAKTGKILIGKGIELEGDGPGEPELKWHVILVGFALSFVSLLAFVGGVATLAAPHVLAMN